MATEIIRQGAGAVCGRTKAVRQARTHRILDRLRAIGARGARMAQNAHRELAEDLGRSDGDGTAIDGKRVRLPTYLFLIVIGIAATWGQTKAELFFTERDLAAHIAADEAWKKEHANDLERLKTLEASVAEKKTAAELVLMQNDHLREENARLYGLMIGSRKPGRTLATAGRIEPHE